MGIACFIRGGLIGKFFLLLFWGRIVCFMGGSKGEREKGSGKDGGKLFL